MRPVADREFELLRQSLLQADGLPFANVWTAEQIQRVCDEEGVSFGEGTGDEDEVVYTPALVLWAFLSQMLSTGEQRSCAAVVARVASYFAVQGRTVSSTNTGAFCRGRAKLPESVPHRLAHELAADCEDQAPDEWRWQGRRVWLADGSTVSLPDTPQNQTAYPQPTSQAAGIGFPIVRIVALVSPATGLLYDAALGPYAGRQTGETALLRTLFHVLQAGDVLLAGRYFGGWFMIALLRLLGVDLVLRLHQLREADFRRGRCLGPGDHRVSWPKPPKPDWMDQPTYDQLPEQLEMREVQVRVTQAGFRTRSLVVVTTLWDEQTYTADDLAVLYRKRWHVELDLRSIESVMHLDVLRCKTPARARAELWMGLLAYNRIRHANLQAAMLADCAPRRLSFTATLQFVAANYLLAATCPERQCDLIALRQQHSGASRVGHRPDRVEPRAIKRRPAQHDLLSQPRDKARAALIAHRAA
jgi:hypothetical protein